MVDAGADEHGLNPVAPVVGTFDSIVVVPEPALMALVVTGAIAVAAMKKRRVARTRRDLSPLEAR